MAATGNEVPTLDQLLMYVKYASDEDIDAYLKPSITPGNFNVAQPSEGNLDGIDVSNMTANADADWTITISGYFDTFYDTGINYGTPVFEIPAEYAPNENVTFYIRDLSYDQDYLCELDTEGIAQYVDSETVYIYRSHRYAIASTITYNISPPSSITGKEVVRLSQVKALLDSGGGGSSGPTWTTAWTGTYQCSTSNYLNISTSSFGYGTTSKMRITASYSIYGNVQDSGSYEITVPSSLPSAAYMAQQIGEFVIDTQTFFVHAYVYNGYVYLQFLCEISSFTSYCAISKVEVM